MTSAPAVRGPTRALVHRLILKREWDRSSDGAGLTVLTDHVHLTNRAATMVADLVEAFVADPR